MKFYRLTLFSFFLMFVVAMTGCKKDDGPVGPQGPEGPEGPAGNANVQSEIITVLSSEWEDEGYLYSFTSPSSVITEEIAESGAVLCYLLYDGIYRPLPFSATVEGDDVTTHIGFEYQINEIFFFFQTEDGMTPAPGEITFKVVAIESSGLDANPGIQDMDYADAMVALGLER